MAPETWARRAAVGESGSRSALIGTAGFCTPGPSAKVQVAPSAQALTVATEGEDTRTADQPGPLRTFRPLNMVVSAGTLETSSLASASNTSHTASPRRKAAAPSGAFHGKCSSTWPWLISPSMRTTPPVGIGSTLGAGGGPGGVSGGFWNRLT